METEQYLDQLEKALLPAVMFLSTSDRKWLTQKKLRISNLSEWGTCRDESEEIVTLGELRKKLLRIQKLKISSGHLYKQGFNSANLHSSMNAESIITHLCQNQYFDDAIELAESEFDGFDYIIKSISTLSAFNQTVVKSKRHDDQKLTLQNNQTVNLVGSAETDKFTTFLKATLCRLEQFELSKNRSEGRARNLYEIAVKCYVNAGVESLPLWLRDKFGSTGMLRIMLRAGRVREAGMVLIEMLKKNSDIMTAQGPETITQPRILDNIPWKIVEELLSFIQAEDFDLTLRKEIEASVECYLSQLETMDDMITQRKTLQT